MRRMLPPNWGLQSEVARRLGVTPGYVQKQMCGARPMQDRVRAAIEQVRREWAGIRRKQRRQTSERRMDGSGQSAV